MTTPENLRELSELPSDFAEQARQRFDKISDLDMNFEEYLEFQTRDFRRKEALKSNPALKYQPIAVSNSCGNGDFEKELDGTQWQGGYGSLPLSATDPFGNFTDGIFPGTLTQTSGSFGDQSGQAHQTWVGAGTDPNVGIPTTAQGSSGAVRIGNAVNGLGCELLSKTFVVTGLQSLVTFWYAVVLQNPAGHPANIQPFFWVRVTDALGNIVAGAFDFGNGSDRVVADQSNPFFQSTTVGNETIVYKDWSCAQIDLSSQVGQQVTVEFITGDCGAGGHWGYAYIDSFCGNCKGSPTGDISYNCETSTHCGEGNVCFDYSLPTAKDPQGNPITGSIAIALDIYQNGVLLTQLSSGILTSGDSYCFAIDPAAIPGINPSLGGFDMVATGTFALAGTPLGHLTVGTKPDGLTPGQNNDYQIACKTCADIQYAQNISLSQAAARQVNALAPANCDCAGNTSGKCGCQSKDGGSDCCGSSDCQDACVEVEFPDLKPCISVTWGNSTCDCLETDDIETLFVTVCNPYSNVTFNDLTVSHIVVTDLNGNAVATLPDGTASVQLTPSGPICFGDVGPCKDPKTPTCVSRELILRTRGAIGKDYLLSLEGVCFTVSHHFVSEHCFIMNLCAD
jgi:hypothetical protein